VREQEENFSRSLIGKTGSNILPTVPTISERLEMEAQSLRSKLLDVEAALTALKDNPDVEQVINLVSKAQHGLY